MRTTDFTRTGCRNIPTAASKLDQARKQARLHDCVVGFVTQGAAQIAFPTDSQTGDIWPVENLMDAQTEQEARGWTFELLEAR